MSKVFGFLLSFFILSQPALAVPVSSRTAAAAAIVNDKVITLTDVRNRVRMAILSSGMPETNKLIKELTPQILTTMIEETLQRQMAEKVGIKIEDGDVDYAIREIEQQNQMKPGQLISLLEKKGIPGETMRSQVRSSTLWREYIRARYGDYVQITKEQIDRKLEEIKASKDEPQILLGEIMIPVNDSRDEEKAFKTIKSLADKASKGARFSALAQQFSSAASAARGGDIGWVSETRLSKELADAAQTTQTGSLSKPVRTQEGYVLLMVRDRRAAGESLDKDTFYSFRQLVFPLPSQPSQEDLYHTYNQVQSIANSAKSCSMLDSLVAKRKGIQSQKIQKASSRSMPFDLKKLLDSLKVGHASKPVLTPNGAMLFMLCKKEEYNPESPTRETVKNLLKGQELTKIAERELRNLKATAFVDIRL
tara:strand:- start:231 stop:1496 length:1266 start_codon:yes stop_codon:yes gene_type:complete